MEDEQVEKALKQFAELREKAAARLRLGPSAKFTAVSDDRLMGCIAPGSVVEVPYQVYRNSVAVAPPAVCGDKPSRPGPMECEHVEGGVAGGAPRENYQYVAQQIVAGLVEQNDANKKQIVRLMAERDALKVELADCRRRLGERDASLLRAVGRR